MGPYAGVDYNLTLCQLKVDYNTFTIGNPMPESTLTIYQSRLYLPVRDFGYGLCLLLKPMLVLQTKRKGLKGKFFKNHLLFPFFVDA